jgi:Rrf2 family transcriptional regulator, cysteine metabolism repressor
MKLSTRTRYGIRAMLELAENYGKEPVQLKTIACHQNISAKYLEQLMIILKSAGIVRSVMGPKGGYLLARPADRIKVSDCFNCLEGPIITTECVRDNNACQYTVDCIASELWSEVQDAIMSVLQPLTLQNLVDRSNGKRALDYSI